MPNPSTIVVNAEFPDALVERIRQAAPHATVLSPSQLAKQPEAWRDVEVLLTHHVSPERLAGASKLRWIQTIGAGVEWLLTPEIIARKDLLISNASGVHPGQIAEHSFMLMLALTRRLPRVLLQQREQRWDAEPFRQSIPTLAGATLGILGVGAIGSRLAELGAAFGMRVLGLRRNPQPAPHVERMYGPDELHQLLSECRYVVNALPLTAATRGLIGSEALAVLPRGAVLINIGRGPTFDSEALVEALQNERLGGAGLDVTDPEPLPAQHPLWRFENVIITPHYSGGRPGYMDSVTDIFLENLRRFGAGEPLQNVVDVNAGY